MGKRATTLLTRASNERRSTRCSQHRRTMSSDHQFLIRWNDEDIDCAIAIVDALARRIIRSGIDAYAEPVETLTDSAADFARMLADAAGEDQAVQPGKRCRHRRHLLCGAEGEELDCLPCRSFAARKQRAHVRRDTGDAEQARFVIE